MKVAIVSVGTLPLPAVDGGAVETLIDNLTLENEMSRSIDIDVFSIYSENAIRRSKDNINTTYHYITVNKFVEFFDLSIYNIIGKVFKKYNVSYKYMLQRVVFAWKIRKKIKKDYDTIVFEASQFLSISLLNNKINDKTNIIFHVHNQLKKGFFLKKMLSKAHFIVSVSSYIQNYMINSYPMIEKKAFLTLRNQVNSRIFKPAINKDNITGLKHSLGIEENDTILVFLGRISKEKGVKEVCETVRRLNNPNIKLMIIGATFFNSDIKDQYKIDIQNEFIDIEDKIIFTGYVEHDLVPQYLALSNIAICPALWDEPAALTNMEILSCGVPLITTNGGGTLEYISEKATIIVNRDEKLVNNIVKAVNKMLTDKEHYKSLKKEAMLFYKSVSTEKYYNDFKKILKNKGD